MRTKYFTIELNGKKERIHWYPELSTPQHKACILTRFALFRIPLITSGNRATDRRLTGQWLRDNGMTWADTPPGCELHHNAFGDFMEWIPIEIHRKIHHIGAIGIYNRA